jgi:hypothetical protein
MEEPKADGLFQIGVDTVGPEKELAKRTRSDPAETRPAGQRDLLKDSDG